MGTRHFWIVEGGRGGRTGPREGSKRRIGDQGPGGDLRRNFTALPIPQLSLDLFYTEDEIYELSYAREPRCPKSLVSLDS